MLSWRHLHTRLIQRSSLRSLLTFLFVFLLTFSLSVIGWLSFRSGSTAVEDLTGQLQDEISARVSEQIETYLSIPPLINRLNADSIIRGEITGVDEASQRQMWQLVQTFPNVSAVQFALEETGEYVGVVRPTPTSDLRIQFRDETTFNRLYYYNIDDEGYPGTLIDIQQEPYDPRERPWYREAINLETTRWGNITPAVTAQALSIDVSTPVYDRDGELLGVTVVDIFLTQLSEYIRDIQVSRSGVVYVMDMTGNLVATSSRERPFAFQAGHTPTQIKAYSSSVPLIRHSADHLFQSVNGEIALADQRDSIMLNNERIFISSQPVGREIGLNWVVVVTIPASDVMGRIYDTTYLTGLLGIFTAVAAVLLGLYAARWVSRPVADLNRSARYLAQGQWTDPVQVHGTRELHQLADSFNNMAAQLRNLVTDLENRVEQRTTELKHARDVAESASQAKSDFLSSMSHELRTPLNGILGYTQVLKRHPQILPAHVEGLNIIEQSGEHLLTLINDILDLSKIEARKFELQPEPVQLPVVLNGLASLFSLRAQQKNLSLEYRVLNQLPSHLQLDVRRLRQILMNLLGNAIKFTEQGAVTFTVSAIESNPNEATISFTITDTGVGIDPADLNKIFAPFEQVGNREQRAKGTGLGLAISHRLVKAMGSDIQVRSTPGKGSEFHFTLTVPTADPPHKAKLPQLNHVIGYEGRSYTILVADDEPYNRQLLVDLLSPLGFTVHTAADGQAAVATAQEVTPDLILIDLVMPIITGPDVAHMLRGMTTFQHTPLIAISANIADEELMDLDRINLFDTLLPKPLKLGQLLQALQTHLPLRWIYRQNEPSTNPPTLSMTNNDFDLDEIVLPPKDVVNRLHHLARQGNLGGIVRYIDDELPAEADYRPYIDIVRQLARSYLEDKLTTLIKKTAEHQNSAVE